MKVAMLQLILSCILLKFCASFPVEIDPSHFRDVKSLSKRSSMLRDGTERDCSDPNNTYLPPTAVNTTERLKDLREEMAKQSYDAYIVPSSDPHLSEYVSSRDKKRAWITGFSGSAGTAVITDRKAAVWSDGRYTVQVEQQLDCNWIFMLIGEPGVPTIEEWLTNELSTGALVGANPFLFSIDGWKSYASILSSNGMSMEEVIPDLIDGIWYDRPPPSPSGIMVQPLTYAGLDWEKKLSNTRTQMNEQNVDFLLLTLLDEIAWFFNLRGGDIPYTPVFTSFAIVTKDSDIYLFVNLTKFDSEEIRNHLKREGCVEKNSCVTFLPYDEARTYLKGLVNSQSDKVWMASDGTNYAMYSVVNENQQISSQSPIKYPKSLKNEDEIAGMKEAHIYDAVALCEYLQWLEVNVPRGVVNEINGADYAESRRLAQPTSRGLSFGTISASGPNGAIIHYGATPASNRQLSVNDMYMVDSGGQYLGGTTDVTRTTHYGKPTSFQKETFTRVLMGQIDVQMAVFAYNKIGNYLDMLARRHLYDIGLEYRHGTGHGIGQYLTIHEYPPGFSTSLSEKYAMKPGMFVSVEPGYYETGQFGLRHENINLVVKATTQYNFDGYEFYTFEPVTLVPYDRKLIKVSLLNDDQLNYLNNYHDKVREVIGNEAIKQGKSDLKEWLDDATRPIHRSSSSRSSYSILLISMLSVVAIKTCSEPT